MKYTEIIPGEKLRPYVKCYFIFESDAKTDIEDIVFPNGFMEVMFNLGEGIWRSSSDGKFYTTPPVELWGQLTKPLAIQAKGKNVMLGIRFFAHSAAYFLSEEVSEFNNQIADFRDVLGSPVRTLYDQLLHSLPHQRIKLIEHFLFTQLVRNERKIDRINMVGNMVNDMSKTIFADSMGSIASKYNISPRYLQKLFLQYTGVAPKLHGKIHRFQLSLKLVSKKELPLTSIAYECGYFDQSHFIREFKSFTGFTPSAFSPETFPVTQAFANN